MPISACIRVHPRTFLGSLPRLRRLSGHRFTRERSSINGGREHYIKRHEAEGASATRQRSARSPGVFDVIHQFRLEPLPDGRTRLHQNEQFRGVLIPFSGGTLRTTREAFALANAAIKARSESLR